MESQSGNTYVGFFLSLFWFFILPIKKPDIIKKICPKISINGLKIIACVNIRKVGKGESKENNSKEMPILRS